MKRFLYILLTIYFIFQSSFCVCQVVQEWQASYIGPGVADFLHSMVIDNYGNVYVTGHSRNTINSSDYATVKYSTSGIELWTARYGGLPNRGATAFSVAADRFGNACVTGYAPLSTVGGRYTTIKYNQLGVQCWVKIYYGAFEQASNIPYSITTDYDANVYVTGGSYFDTTAYDFTTVKYDSSGTEQWVARYWHRGQDWAMHSVLDNFGNVYVTGYSIGDTTYEDIATVKFNSSGVQQWAARYNGPGNRGDSVNALAVDDSGNVYVTGSSWGGLSTRQDYVTIKYNSVGRLQWVARYNGAGNETDKANSSAVDDSGNVYVTGLTNDSASESDCATIKYNKGGIQQWIAIYDFGESDRGRSVTVDKHGYIYVAAESWGGLFGTRFDFATIKYSPSGEELWVIRTSGSVDEKPSKIAVDSLGNVYVSGNNGNYLTIKYNQLTGVSPLSNELPGEYYLYQNYPNPFNPTTTINYELPKDGTVKLIVYDILGREVSRLVNNEFKVAGKYLVVFEGSNLSSGIYLYKIRSGSFTDIKRMVLIK